MSLSQALNQFAQNLGRYRCNVGCPFIGRAFDDNWGLEDPTGSEDQVFVEIIREIEKRILQLKQSLI